MSEHPKPTPTAPMAAVPLPHDDVLSSPPAPRQDADHDTGPDQVIIFCDGASLSNPGPAGSGVVIVDGDKNLLAARAYALGHATNNEAELMAAIEALRLLHAALPGVSWVTLRSDSQYVINGMTSWLAGWKRKGWMKADGKPVLNRPLWEALEEASKAFPRMRWMWVRGHAGDTLNEMADGLAGDGARVSQVASETGRSLAEVVASSPATTETMIPV